MSKWSKTFWIDYAERVGSTLGYALIGLLTSTAIANPSPEVLWATLGLPVALSVIKGLLANVASPDSGASLVPNPPGPEVQDGGFGL